MGQTLLEEITEEPMGIPDLRKAEAGERSRLLDRLIFCSFLMGGIFFSGRAHSQEIHSEIYDRPNLVAWCIVPFDSQKRTPSQRAEMLDELRIRRLAYDYRAEHVTSFEEEILTLKKHGIELTAWWFPTVLNDEAKLILSLCKKHDVHPQLWVTGGGDPAMPKDAEVAFMASEVKRLREIALAAQEANCQVALYNHGGWFGIPENQLRLIDAIDLPNVGIVYNLHHAHDQIERLPEILNKIGPKLLALNLNGMQTDGDRIGKKILVIGQGDRDRDWVRVIGQSGFRGPIGILNHTDLDARQRLIENLQGLDRLVKEASSQP
jgi:sugar phosphate isomerase/epimerase